MLGTEQKLLLFIYLNVGIIPIYATVERSESIITKIENDIYGFDYSNDSSQNRVSRLEKSVYGKTSTGDINKRIKRLSADISADVIGLPTTIKSTPDKIASLGVSTRT